MGFGELGFVLLAANPFAGLFVAIPFATFQLEYPAWVAALAGTPLAFLQVPFVDLGFDRLSRWPRWRNFIERRRSVRIERLIQSGGAFWPTLVIAPLIGPWILMALMRYGGVPMRRVALPMFLGLGWMAALVAAVCMAAPEVFK